MKLVPKAVADMLVLVGYVQACAILYSYGEQDPFAAVNVGQLHCYVFRAPSGQVPHQRVEHLFLKHGMAIVLHRPGQLRVPRGWGWGSA